MINLVRIFAWQLMNIAGYQPELYHCLGCQEKIKAGQNFFEAVKGGLRCTQCATSNLLAVSDNAIKVLRLFSEKEISDFTRLKIDDKLRVEVNQIVDLFVETHLEGKLKTLSFITAQL